MTTTEIELLALIEELTKMLEFLVTNAVTE